MRHPGKVFAVLVAAGTLALATAAQAATVTFDFNTAAVFSNLPLDQTSGGVTGHFTGPFSIQNAGTTGFVLSQFSGNYLYPNAGPGIAVILNIAFDQPLSSISLIFATADFNQNELPTTIQLTAYQNSTATQVGSATAIGTYTTDTMPQGTLSFGAGAQTFNLVEIKIAPNQPLGVANFLVDNVTVTTAASIGPPAPVIVSGPVSPTKQTSATFEFSDADSTATFLCALDDSAPGAFVACTSPQSYGPGLAEGSHTFFVKARDLAGNDSALTSFTWSIDLTAPGAIIDSMPLDPTSQTTADFTFHATEPGSTLECSLDGAAFAACTSPASYPGLADGLHSFAVRAMDLAGNTGNAASFSWTIDTQAPDTVIDSAPPLFTNSNTATFTFHAIGAIAFTCQLDAQPAAACNSGTVTYPGLGEGSHTFTVKATDAAGNTGPAATFSWVVDQTAPTVAFGAPSPGPNANGWNNTDVSVPFTASDALSGIATVTPPSPLVLSAEGSAVTGTVTAADNAGNSVVATSPAVKIDKTPPSVTITTPADGAAYVVGATVLASYSCSDPLSGVASCAGPVPSGSAIDTASVGSKTFTVAATDNAGNPATRTVTYSVVTTPPPGKAAISGSVVGKGDVNPAIHFYDLKFTNTGTDAARNVMLSQFSFKTLAGRGNVSYEPTRSPKLPIALGDLAVGASKTIRVFLVVPPPVAKFSITEMGQFEDPTTGTTVPFSTSQDVSRLSGIGRRVR